VFYMNHVGGRGGTANFALRDIKILVFITEVESVFCAVRRVLINANKFCLCRSQWPRGVRRRSAAAGLLRSWVRISPGAWIFVCCVLLGRGLCDELITRREESYRLLCVVVCDLETLRMRRPWPALVSSTYLCLFLPIGLFPSDFPIEIPNASLFFPIKPSMSASVHRTDRNLRYAAGLGATYGCECV
jgi:hypothetical protein